MLKHISLITLFFIAGWLNVFSQNKTREEFIHDFTKERFIVWPDAAKGKETFIVAIVNDSALFKKLEPLLKKKPLFKKRRLTLKYFNSFAESATIKAGVIYLHANSGISMTKAIQAVQEKPILVVGENYPYHQSMINFISLGDNISFEYDKTLIEKQGLTVTDELNKLSALNEIQWNKLLAEAEAKLKKEESILVQQKAQINATNQALNQANQTLSVKNNELATQDSLIDSTTAQLSLREKEIAFHKKEKQMQADTIRAQNNFITTMIVACALGLLALFLIYRSYSLSRKSNAKLTELNKTLKLHKDEIFVQKTIVEEKRKEITDSILYAQRIQKSLLPSLKIFNTLLPENFILFRPKDIVSGDFYWFDKITDNRILFTVVDCTGHGVPGALMSVIGINQLNKIVHENRVTQPHLILQELDFAIRATLNHGNNEESANDGMEMSICLLDKETNTLYFSGACNPLWVVTNNPLNPSFANYTNNVPVSKTDSTIALIEIPADKKPIAGMYKYHHEFTLHTLTLQKGDCIYMFSDGYADQFGGIDGKKFKKQQLKDTLVALNHKNMGQQHNTINTLFDEWKGKFEQIDDVCILGIRL